MKNTFTHIIIVVLAFCCCNSMTLNAQNICIGGGNITIELVCLEMLAGGEFGDEEITILTTPVGLGGNALALTDCTEIDDDLGSGGTSSSLGPGLNTIVIPIPYTPGGNFGDNIDFLSNFLINYEIWEDDGGGRCSFDGGDDDYCPNSISVDLASLFGPGGSCLSALNSDGSVDACTVVQDNVIRSNCNGDWVLTYQVTVDLTPPIELSCPGFMSPNSAPVTVNAFETGTTDLLSGGTWSIASGGGIITDNADGSASFDPTGTTPGTSVQLVYTGDNCCQTITTSCFVSIIECPQITAATVASDNCVGEDITLTATISPATAVINQDYILVWQENGTDIAASSSAGADGVPGTADDIISSTYMHTLLAGTATGCAVDDRVFTAELYCLTDFILDAGDPTMTGTDPANTVIEYNAVGQTCIDLDLSTVPTCALASNFSFTTTASSGPPFGNSWISELELEVFQPTGSIGVFTDPLAPNSAGTSTFSGGTNFGGLSSTTPATGIWQMCYEDNFNDNGGATEGVVNHANLTVSSLFPPGCSINSSTTSSVDAVNASTTPLASAPVNAADEVTGLRVCNDPTITTDFTVPTGCTDFAITDVCGSLSIGYASSAAGPFDHALTDASSLVTPADGEQIFYEIYFDADGDGISDCPACATTTGSWTLTACPPPCSITLVNPINIICVDPGTPGDPSDDYIEFSLIVEGASAAGGFSFTSTDDNVTGGCTLTYGTTHSTFRGSPGSAGGGDITLNIVDCGDLSCTAIGTVTDPGACSIPPPPVNNVCDCSNADTPYQINVVATAGPTGYTLIYVLVDNDNGNTVLANNQTGMFAAVADNTNYTVYAFNVLDAELTAFTTALPTTIMTGDDILLEQGAFMDFCYEISEITLNESCNCCPDVTAIPDADLMLGVTESTCTEINGTPMGGVLTAPSPGCPPGSTIQYSLNGGPFQTTLPMHSQASVQTINVRCICDVDDSVISDPVQTVTNPGVCPIPSPLISIDKNDNDDGDDTQTVDVGGTATFSIEICNESTEPLCDLTVAESASIVGVDLSNCEMSGADLIVLVQGTGNGDDQLDPTECISFTCDVPNIGDDFVNTMSVLGIGCDSGIPVNDSDDSDVVLGCPDLGGVFPPQANVEAESICVAVGGSVQVDGGIIKEPIESCMAGGLSECPPGSHIEYSMNGGAWQIDLPVYVQTMAMEIRTRCVCNTDQAVVSETCTVETVPGTCPDPVANVCDCTDLTNPFTINTVAIGGGADYSLLYVLVDNDNGNSVLQNNTTGMFMSVADNVNYSVYAFNVLTTELGTFTGALPATIASGDAILIMTAPFDTFCYDHTVTSYNEDCGCCPELTDATLVPQANIQSNSICTTIGGGGLDIDGGVIAAPVATCGGGTPATCPEGSTLEYSIDGGTWQTDIPVYVQNTSISIQTRCICETDPTSVIEGCTVVTEPGICMDCPADLATFMPGDAVINFESACTDGNVLGGGLISQPNNACPEGSTIQYLVTNSVGVVQSDWSTTLPTYDQNTSITIQTRCTCDSNGANSLFSPGITTTPGVCPDEPANVCDCTMAPNSLTINKIAVNGGQPDYSIVYSLLEVGTTNHIFSDPMGGVASFPNLAEGVDYQFCAYNVLTSELADFSTALADAAAHEDAADGQFFMADGVTEFCYTVSCEIINEDCGCCIANAGDQSTDDCTSFCEGDPAAIVTVDIEFALDASSLASEGPIPGTEYAVYVTDASGKIISLAGQATISTPVQNLSFPVDISAFAVGDYCIHGVNIDLNDPDLNATTLVDFVDLNISSLGNLLTESDGSLTINDATVCGDVNVDNCTPFTITEEITFEAVAICRDFIDISAEADLTGTNYYIEVTNITGGSGTYTVDVGGQTTPLVGNTYGPFNHTGLGTGVVTITVTDDNSTNPTGCVDCVATAEVIETICAETVCDCDASPDGGSILAQSTGYNAIDHCMVYTITKPDGTIEVNETGFYDALPDGEYTVCAFNVLTADKPLFVAALTDATAVELAAAIDASFAAFCYDGLCYDETVECFPDPTLADVKLECTVLGGNVSLSSLFTATTTPGGIFTLAADSPTGATINGGNTLNFSAPGCYHVEYTVGDCPLTDDAFICVPQQPEPSFSIQDEVCFSAGDDPATHIYTPKLNVTPVGTVTWAIDGSSTASGSVDMDGLVTVTSTGVLMICMTEEISYAACGTNAAGSCEATFCQQITITDGTAQDASFTISAQDQCPGTEIVLTPMVEGGEFSGDGVIDNGLGTGATVNIPADCSSVDVTYTLNDPNGCTSSGTQTVFGDRNDPTINVTNVTDLILECNDPNNNNEMLIADWLAANGGATADDACTMTWEYDLVAETDNCSNTGTGTYRFTVTDQCGNFASVEADIIINDNEDPVVVPPTPLVLTCAELSETVDPSLLIKDFCEGAAATDDCDTEVLITHDFTGTLLDLCTAGTVTINFTATDNCGNTHTLPSTITVTPDALAPVFVTEPADLTLDCGDISETTAVTIEGWLNSVTISDACDTDPVLTHDYTQETLDICTAAGSPITVTWTATDACGNMDTRSAILTITPDTAPPVFDTEPANLTLDCGDINETTAVTIEGWLNSVTISDACDTDPVLTHNYTEESLDLCDVAIINNRSSFTVIWTATDACGNMDTRSAVLTITPDTAPPTFDTEPADITLDCGDINETTAITIEGWLNSVTISDICDTDPVLTHDYTQESLDLCTAAGSPITVTWTATDACGNTDTRSAVLTITPDIAPPVFDTEPADLTLDCGDINETTAVTIEGWLNSVTISDVCDTDPVLTHDYTQETLDLCTAAGSPITVTWTATDACGNMDTRTAVLTITPDIAPPVFNTEPADLTLDCGDINETTVVTIEGWLNSVTISDACDTDPVLTHNYTEESLDLCGVPIVNTRSSFTVIWTATDACGNTDTRSAVLTITPDTAPPVFDTEPANLTLDCGDINETTAVTIEGWLNSVTISDACDTDPVLTHDFTTETLDVCTAAGSPFTITWTATDACGNTDTRSAVLTITPDIAPPVFDTEPADLTLDCGDINETTAVTIEGWLNSVTISDACDTDPVLTHDFTTETLDVCTAAGSPFTITWTATDACGNTDTRSAVLTITPDIAPPVFDTEPADLTLDCGDINETTAVTIEGWLNSVTISDACDTDPVLTHDFTTETLDVCTAAGSPFTITWTATDACGNTDTRSAVLTITPDIAPPVFDTEPADLTLDCGDINETTAVTIEGWLNSVTISDACDTDPVLTHDFTTETLDVCTAAGSPFTITWTATDACGNTDTRSAVLTITPDTAPPVFDVEPSDLTLDCGQINETTAITIEGWLNEVQVTDLCDTDPVLTHNFNTQTLDLCTAAGSPITVTWTATDACGNTDSRSAILTITPDVAPPMFDVEPLDIVLDCGDINETTAVTIEGWLNAVEISDICDTDPVLTHDYTTEVLDLCTAAGSPITVTWTATDACGNTDTRSATLTITPDTAPPTFDVEPADLTLSCAEINENVAVTIEGWLNDVQISDACDTDPVLVHDFTTQNLNVCTAAGSPITVTWTASDACGNVDTRTAVLTIIPDVTPPVLSCTGLTTSGDTPFYDCEGDISWDHPLATDDCHVAIYTYTITDPDGTVNGPFDLTGAIASGNLATSFDFEEGVSIVTYYAEDDCGNPSTCSFDVSVGDSVNPFFLDCPADLFVGNDPDECSAKVNWEVPVAWDNCDIPANPDQIELDTSLVVTQLIGFHGANSYDDIQSGQVIPVGNYLIGYLVVDTDGNTDTCSFNLTVWDTQDPILMAGIPEDVTLSCEIQLDTFVMQPHHVMDNCVEDPTIENTLVSTRVMDPEVCEYYSYQDTFFYTVTDSVQILPDGSPKVNQMIWKWVVTWIDTTAPQIIPPPDTLIETCTFDVEIIKSVVQVDSIQVDSLVAVGDDWVIVTVQLKKDSIVCDTIFTPIPISDRMNGLPIVDDNCAPDSLFVLEKPFLTFRDSIEFLCKGDKSAIVHRWWIAEDPCGNIDSAKQLITILADPNPPVLDVYAQDTISLGPDGHVILTRDDLVKSVFNACFADETLITVEISPNYFNCSDIGVHSVLVSATDPCSSQTAYEYVEVTIIDDIAPVLNCPVGSAPIPLTINPRNCDGAFNDILDILDGNDCDVTITTDPPLDASIDMNTTEISVTATDASGNSTTCVVSVSISLTEPIDFDAVLSCNDRVNISLNNECWLELTPDQILEGSPDVCTALLCIEVEDNTGADHLNFFDVTDVGQVFRIRVVDCNGSGNSCWGEVLLEEKQIPEIVWPQDTSVLCVEPTDTSYFKILIPEILNCEPVISIEYEDSYVEYDQCSTPRATITRKWTVTDDEGNVAVDTQLIDIMPFSNNHVRFPKDITIEDPIDCKLVTESIDDIENNILDPTSLLHPDSTGLPNIFGLPLQTNAGLCLFSLGYEDRVLEICSGSYQIFRKWEVNDVCSPYVEGVNPVSHTQVITIYDNDGPVLEEAEIPANDTLSYNPWECAYSGPLKVPGGDIESCGDIFFEAYVTGGGYIVTDGTYGGGDLQIAAVGMGPGDHWITYVYTDGCNNISLYKYVVTVIDEVAPVAVCQGDISITVTTDGVAKIYAKDIDGGSHDAGCGPVSTCIVRMVDFEAGYLGSISGYDAYVAANGCHIDGEFRDTIFDKLGEVESISTVPYVLCKDELKVCCSDLGDQTIVLKATDPTGLSSICMSPISIVDKSNASLVCLPHAIDCTDDKDVDILPPTGSSSICGDELPLKYIDEDEFIDGCGEGQIFRVWYLDANDNGSLDDNEISCNQVITVTNSTSFDPYSLKWPKHYTGEIVSGKNLECNEDDELIELTEDIEMGAVFTCAATDPGDKPVWCNTSCGLVGLSSEIDTVTAGDACLKIIKRWTVVDWCYWEANGASPGDDANDTDNDSFEAVEDWAQGVCSGCTENLADPIYFRYIEVDIDGYYTYDQVIKVVDDTDPVVTTADVIVNTSGGAVAKGDDTPCSGTGIVTASASDLCGSDAITGELISWVIIYNNGTDVTVSNAEGSDVSIETEAGQPGDVHTVTFEVKDGCGNRDAVISTITFGDEKKPVPLCIAGVTTAFMESTGTVDVWAKDFDLGSFDNCTDVDFTVVFRGESPDSSQANITFDCDDITKLYDLDIWVWDENGNGDFCTTSVIIGGTCEGDEGASSALISGQISTALGDMIEEAEVTIGSSGISEYPLSQMTTSSGEYAFLNNPTGFDFDITVLKDGDYLNGVTTADLIAIQEHISGEALLDSPYKVIAADINNDQQVSILDVIVLRNVILGISRRFTNNTSWRFVDESQSFADMFSPWPFIEVLDIPSLATDQLSEDFIGVKIGDVTDDVAANSFALASSRTDEYLDFEITEAFIEESNTVLVPVSSDRFENIVGFQFTLEHKGLEFEGIESGAIDISSEHIGQHEDALTVSWDNLDPITSDETLFSFRFTASSDVELSDALTLNSKITKAEIYRGTEIDMANLGLQISTQDIGLAKLHQNDPNPFVSQTTIGFELPVASEAILLIYTIDGKELKRIEGNFAKGLNEVIVTESDIDFSGGLLYYQLQVGEFTDTKKMMVVK